MKREFLWDGDPTTEPDEDYDIDVLQEQANEEMRNDDKRMNKKQENGKFNDLQQI